MDKSINIFLEIENKYSLNYRFINVSSSETGESINIGLIIEEKEKTPRIKIIENIDIVEELFPIFDANHIRFCKKAIEVKYKMKKVTRAKLKISQTVSLSDSRLHKINYNNLHNIDEILFEKYISIQKTQSMFSNLYKKFKLINNKLRNLESDNIINVEVITKPLIHSEVMEHRLHLLKKAQKIGLTQWNH